MKFLKAFSGEETNRQKRVRQQFYSIFTYVFLWLMHITRFDKFLCWQQATSWKNKKVILFTLGALIILMNISIFFRNPAPPDTTAAANWGVIQSLNVEMAVKTTDNPRVIRLAQILDSLKVNNDRMEYDSVYHNRIVQFALKKMADENLLEIPSSTSNKAENK